MSTISRIKNFAIVRVCTKNIKYFMLHPPEQQKWMDFKYEPILTDEIDKIIRSQTNPIFWDVGSAFGIFSKLVAVIRPDAKIYSFEPYWLRRLISKINLFLFSNVKISNKKISDIKSSDAETFESIHHATKMIPTLIKMDIEGYEYHVIKSSRDWINKYRPIMLIEFHENIMRGMGLNPDDIFEQFRDDKFNINILEHHNQAGGNYLIMVS